MDTPIYSDNGITQYKICVEHNWRNADERVQRCLTQHEITAFVDICTQFGAVLTEVTIFPGCGWLFKIKTGIESLSLSHEINKFVKGLPK